MAQSGEFDEKKEAVTVNVNDLVDIKDVEINVNLPKDERINDFIRQIKNPYLFKCGNIVVESEFSQTDITFSERLKQYMRMR